MTKPQNQLGAHPDRLLRRKNIESLFGISRSTIYARLDPASKQYDPAFPRKIQLSAKSVAWLESECQAYIQHLITTSRA